MEKISLRKCEVTLHKMMATKPNRDWTLEADDEYVSRQIGISCETLSCLIRDVECSATYFRYDCGQRYVVRGGKYVIEPNEKPIWVKGYKDDWVFSHLLHEMYVDQEEGITTENYNEYYLSRKCGSSVDMARKMMRYYRVKGLASLDEQGNVRFKGMLPRDMYVSVKKQMINAGDIRFDDLNKIHLTRGQESLLDYFGTPHLATAFSERIILREGCYFDDVEGRMHDGEERFSEGYSFPY